MEAGLALCGLLGLLVFGRLLWPLLELPGDALMGRSEPLDDLDVLARKVEAAHGSVPQVYAGSKVLVE